MSTRTRKQEPALPARQTKERQRFRLAEELAKPSPDSATGVARALHDGLRAELKLTEDQIWQRCSLADLLHAYDVPLEKLGRIIRHTEATFLPKIIETTFQFANFTGRAEQLEMARQRMWELLGEFRSVRFSRPHGIKSLQLVERPSAQVEQTLRGYLEQSIDIFVDELASVMVGLAGRGVVGGIRFAANGLPFCAFSHFRSLATNHERTPVRQSTAQWFFQRDGFMRKKTTTEVEYSGEIVVQHVFHDFLLSGVSVVPLAAATWELPRRISKLVRAMPAVLRPHVSVVSGEIESGRIVASDVGKTPWNYVRRSVREEAVRHQDPALTLGPWVLAGWCPKEAPLCWQLKQGVEACLRSAAKFTVAVHERVQAELAHWQSQRDTAGRAGEQVKS